MPIDLTDRIQQFRSAGHQLGAAPSPDDVATLFRALVMYPLPPEAEGIPGTTDGEVLDRYRVHPAASRVSGSLKAATAEPEKAPTSASPATA